MMDDNERLRDELSTLYWKVKDIYLSLERFMEEDTRFRINQVVQKARDKRRAMMEVTGTPIDDLDFTVRTNHGLRTGGVLTVEQLVEHTHGELLKFPNIGRKSINEIREVLASMNLKLKGE
jgi:DNA-directed RNA polymerase subunit alpha